MAFAERLRLLGERSRPVVVSVAASLRLRDRLGTVALLYPTYRTLEFPLELLWRAGREDEIRELRDALHQIASKPVSTNAPNVGCREALAHWEAVAWLIRSGRPIWVMAGSRSSSPAWSHGTARGSTGQPGSAAALTGASLAGGPRRPSSRRGSLGQPLGIEDVPDGSALRPAPRR